MRITSNVLPMIVLAMLVLTTPLAGVATLHAQQLDNAGDSENADAVFMSGYSAGMVAMYESQISDAFLGWSVLKGVKGAAPYRKLLTGQINTALLALAHAVDEVKQKPDMLKLLVRMASADRKDFYQKLKDARQQNGWLLRNPESEQKVQWVIDQHLQHGNVYGFQF